MKALRSRFPNGVVAVAATLVALVALPVLAVLAFVARFALIPVLVAALVGGGVLYAASPRFRAWLKSLLETEISYKGLRLSTDVAVAPVHTWAMSQRGGVLVGSDDIAPTVLGPVATVELPGVGHRFRRGEPFARLWRGARSVVLRAPVSGTVTERNDALYERPELINEEPFSGGWLVRLSDDGPAEERTWLRRGGRAGLWFRCEVDRLIGTLVGQHDPMAAAADGGLLIAQIHREIDEVTWQQLSEEFFAGRTPRIASSTRDRCRDGQW